MLDDESMKIAYGFVGGESANTVRILQQPGVINWNTNIKILKGIQNTTEAITITYASSIAFKKRTADRIMELVRDPNGKELAIAFKVKRYKLLTPITSSAQR